MYQVWVLRIAATLMKHWVKLKFYFRKFCVYYIILPLLKMKLMIFTLWFCVSLTERSLFPSSPCKSNGTQLFLREIHTSSSPFYSSDSLRCQCRWYIWRGVTKELTRHPEVMVLNAPMTGATSVASSVTFSFFVRAYLINLCFSSVSVCHVSLQKPKMGFRSPETGATGSCEILRWILGTKLCPSRKATSRLSSWPISPVLLLLSL